MPKPLFTLWLCLCCILLCYGSTSAQAADSTRTTITADQVMRLTYTFAARQRLSIGSYEGQAYIRTTVHTHRRNPLMHYMPGYFALEPGHKHYANEMHIAFAYRYPNLVDRKVLANYGNVPRDIQQRERLMAFFNILPYGQTLWRAFALSPFHRTNARYYHYHLDSLVTDSTGQPWAHIAIQPQVRNAQLVRGQAVIQAHTGAVGQMSFEVYYELTRVRLAARMGTDQAKALLPEWVKVDTRLNFLGNRVTTSAECSSTYSSIHSRPDHQLNEADRLAEQLHSPFDHSHAFVHRLDTTAMLHSLAHFDSTRPQPLPDTLHQLFQHHAQSQHTSTPRHKGKHFGRTMEQVLLNGARFAHYDSSGTRTAELRLPPIINPEGLRWSQSRGLFILTKWRAFWQLSPTMLLRSTAHVGYNFRQREWQSLVPIEWHIDTRRHLQLRLEGGKYNNIYDADQFREVAPTLHPTMPYDTLMHLLDRGHYHDYHNYQAHLTASSDLYPGLNLEAGLNYYHRRLKHYDATAQAYGLHRSLRTLALSAKITWTPALHYYHDDRQRHDLYSRWPTFFVSYEHSIHAAQLQANYIRIEGNISHRHRLNAVKSVYFRLGGGGFIKKDKSYFTDFTFFNNNPLRAQLDDDMMGRFQLLDARWYNLSSYYTQASGAYESPMLLVSRVASLSRIIHTERIYANVLYSALLRPYVELGYGIRTPLLDIGVFISGAKGKAVALGVSFEYRLSALTLKR